MPLSPPIECVLADIDAANAADPRHVIVDGVQRPRELVYAERMSACLSHLYPDASAELCIAARAQHVCRWQIPRASYPTGRDGYNAWRTACRVHHADLAAAILRRHGFAQTAIAKVAKIIKKEDLKRDAEAQALENVVAVVFVQYYLDAFLADHRDYDDTKVITILKKTLRKMDATGHAAILGLDLPAHAKRVIGMAVADDTQATFGIDVSE